MKRRARLAFGVPGGQLMLLCLAVPALAAEPGEPAPSTTTLVFYTINFVVFVVLLARYAGGTVKNYFATRARTVSSAFGNLEGALREAKARALEAVERVRQLPSEKTRIEALTRKQTEQEVRAIRDNALNLAAQIARDGDAAARSIGERVERELRAAIARSAAQAAQNLLRQNFEPSDQRRLVEDFVQEIASREAQ